MSGPPVHYDCRDCECSPCQCDPVPTCPHYEPKPCVCLYDDEVEMDLTRAMEDQ